MNLNDRLRTIKGIGKTIIIFSFFLCAFYTKVEGQMDSSSVVSYFVHVYNDVPDKYKKVKYFQLKTPKNAPIPWKSSLVQPILEDSVYGFLIKVDVPEKIMENADMLECEAWIKKNKGMWSWLKYKKEMEIIQYGGINLSVIKLEIKSDPQGAEVYMVPMRIWEKNFKNTELRRSIDKMEFFKVNTSLTNTFVRIDQTVYKIVFHAQGEFKTIIHRPQPQSIEPTQSVSVHF